MLDHTSEHLLARLYSAQEQNLPLEAAPDAGMLGELQKLGLVVADGKLTRRGRVVGHDLVRRHRLAECLLHDVLSVRQERVHPSACEFEHILRHGLDDRICVLLGHPRTCPHGRPIPPGPCCAKAAKDRADRPEVGPLCDGAAGDAGPVAYLATADQEETQKLMSIGVLPGVSVSVVRQSPCCVFNVGLSQFAVDYQLARRIYVHWSPAPGATDPAPVRTSGVPNPTSPAPGFWGRFRHRHRHGRGNR